MHTESPDPLMEHPGEIPQYLQRPQHACPPLGVLRFCWQDQGNLWEIEGDPQVIIQAKRLFPGSAGRGPGIAKFPATKRTFADLIWFMQRWPLEVAPSPRMGNRLQGDLRLCDSSRRASEKSVTGVSRDNLYRKSASLSAGVPVAHDGKPAYAGGG